MATCFDPTYVIIWPTKMYTKRLVLQLQFPFPGGDILQHIYYCWFRNRMNIQVTVA